MMMWFFRLGKRLLVLGFGLVIIYLAVWEFYPFFDNRVPIAFALLATYIFTAYFFLPAIVRVIRVFLKPSHIPLYCVTPDGFASDPVNIGVIGTKKQIIEAMMESGWYLADRRTLRSLFRLGMSLLFRRPYPSAPFSNLFLFGRKQDLGFERAAGTSPSHRHHVRFWACHLDGPEAFHGDVHFWKRFHRPAHNNDMRQLWVGAASKDTGIIPIRHNAQLTHMIAPDTNAERDLIVDSLRASHNVEHTKTVKVGVPYRLRNRTVGGYLHADGRMRICILKD
jgi:hypothetical protein